MTNKTITDLTAASALDGSELLALTQGGNSRKATADQIKTLTRVGAVVGESGKIVRAVAGVVRQTTADGGWDLIDDADHTPIGVSSVSTSASGDLNIIFSFTATKIISFVAGVDETYSKEMMVVGPTVGKTTATLRGSAPMSGVITSSGVGFTGSLGFADVCTITRDNAAGTLKVQHPATSVTGNSTGSSVSLSAVDNSGGDKFGGGFYLTDVDADEFTFNRSTPVSGVVYVSAGTPQVDTLCNGVSVAWNATDDCFDVSIPEGLSGDKFPVISPMVLTPGSGLPYNYAPTYISDADLIKVFVFDNSGAQVTSPANDMRFSFEKPNSEARRSISSIDGTYYQFTRQAVPLDFRKVANASGNIWFVGLFEVSA